jgi:hypothetical protein
VLPEARTRLLIATGEAAVPIPITVFEIDRAGWVPGAGV